METQQKTDTGALRPSLRMKSFSLKSNINLIQASILRLIRFYASFDLSMSSRGRRYFLLAFSLLLISLVAGSNPRRVGDGHEYLAMALNLSEFHLPAPSPEELAHLQERLARLAGTGYVEVPITFPNLVAEDGRQDFPHFWFYSALVVPWVWVTRALRLHPNFSFTIVNMALLALALWVVAGRLHWTAALLLFGSPILRWIDKGHTEVFTFSLLAIAFALLREQPWWSLVCLGAASTQNPPIALVLPIVAVMALITRPGALRDNRFRIGAVVGAALASLHPLYYLSRLGITTPLLRASGGPRLRIPTLDELGAVIWDPNIGLLLRFPAWTVVLLGIAVAFIARACQRLNAIKKAKGGHAGLREFIARARQRLNAPAVWVALFTTGIFLVSFAQITNINHGGLGPSRYTLWLIPLAIPLLQEADTAFSQKLRLWLAPVAISSLVWCLFVFHPKQSDDYLMPTKLATFLWKHHPSLNNPLADVFFERLSHAEQSLFPIATATCSKVLLVGGLWPATCLPEGDVPSHCIDPWALCYANRTARGYEFVEAPGAGYVSIRGEHFYPIGERILFAQGGTGQKHTGPGWFGVEPWGTWTERSTAVVMLKLLDIPDRDLALSIEGQAFLNENLPVQDIEVLVNQHPVETLRYTFPSRIDTRVITIPKSLVQEKKGLLIIKFKIKDPKSPAELGLSTGDRLLGMALVSLRLDGTKR